MSFFIFQPVKAPHYKGALRFFKSLVVFWETKVKEEYNARKEGSYTVADRRYRLSFPEELSVFSKVDSVSSAFISDATDMWSLKMK